MKNRIDTIFKSRLEDVSTEKDMMEKDWQAMKALLVAAPVVAGGGKGAIIAKKLFIAFSVAACVITAVYFLWPVNKPKTPAQNIAVVKQDKQSSQTVSTAKIVVKDSIKILPHKIIRIHQKPVILKVQPVQVDNVTTDSLFNNKPVNVPVVNPVARQNNKQAIDSFYNLLKSPTQLFTINNSRDTVIIGRDSSEIAIPAYSFITEDGKMFAGIATILLDECYSYSDIVGHKLYTVSDSALLQSGGMLQIQALAQNKKLRLAANKQLAVAMPVKKYDYQMQLFLPAICKGCDTANGQRINWRAYYSGLVGFGDKVMQPALSRRHRFFSWETFFGWLRRDRALVAYGGMEDPNMPLVLNLKDDPYKMITRNGKNVGKFRVAKNCALTEQQLIAELKKRYTFYDEIKIIYTRQEHNFSSRPFLSRGWSAPVIGDSIRVTPKEADRLKLWTPAEKERYFTAYNRKHLADSVYNAAASVFKAKYHFNISSLGWMNCDHFYGDPRPKVRFAINLGDTADYYSSQLILMNCRLMVPAINQGNIVIFSGLPVGEQVQFVSVGYKNNKVVTSMQKLTVTKEVVNNIVYDEISADNVKKTLKLSDSQ